MKLHRVLISVIGVAVVLTLGWHTRANADGLGHYEPVILKKAERALQRGDAQRASEMVEARMHEFGRSEARSDAYGLLCRAYFELKQYEQAEQACDEALQLRGNSIAWIHFNNRGVMRLAQGNFDDAIADFSEAMRRNPQAYSARRNLALAEGEVEARAAALTWN